VAADDSTLRGRCGDDTSISSLAQGIAALGKSGTLRLWRGEGVSARFGFREGRIVAAKLGGLSGLDAAAHAVCWQYGWGGFEFVERLAPPIGAQPLGQSSTGGVMLQVMQRVDQCPLRARLREFLGEIDREVALMPGLELQRELLQASEPVRALVEMFGDRASLSAATILTELRNGEIASCEALVACIELETVIPAELLDQKLAYEQVLPLVNLLGRYAAGADRVLRVLTLNHDLLSIPEAPEVPLPLLLRLISVVRAELSHQEPSRAGVYLEMARAARAQLEQAATGPADTG
jgi:hypothetical protein